MYVNQWLRDLKKNEVLDCEFFLLPFLILNETCSIKISQNKVSRTK